MTLQEREKRVHNYFIPAPPTPRRAYVALAIGLLIFILALAGHEGILIFVALLVLAWGAYKYARYQWEVWRGKPKATDQEMDRWLREALLPIVADGRTRLSVHPTELGTQDLEGDRWYLQFHGIPLEDLFLRKAELGQWRPDLFLYYTPGKDGHIRFSRYRIMVVYLSNWRLPVYESVLDIATGATITDATREYHLNQVDGVETNSDRITVSGEKAPGQEQVQPAAERAHFTRQQLVRLVVSGRTAVSLTIGIAANDAIQSVGESRSQVDGLIAVLREHLRAHHHGVQSGGMGVVSGAAGHLGLPPEHSLELPPDRSLELPAGTSLDPHHERPLEMPPESS